MTKTAAQTRTFSPCPECGTSYTAKGMGRHRTTKHGVAPVQPRSAQPKKQALSLAERLERIRQMDI